MSGRDNLAGDAVLSEMFIGKRGRIRLYIFELATALAAPLAGVAFFLDPHAVARHSELTHRVFPFDYLWSAGYIAGGVMIAAGVILPRLRLRAIGLIVLATALVMQVIGALAVHPELRDLVNVIYAAACLTRAALVINLFRRYRRMAPIAA